MIFNVHEHPVNLSCRNDSFKIERSWTVDEYMGYLSSWSAWHTYLQDHPNSDAMELVRQRYDATAFKERVIHIFQGENTFNYADTVSI